MIDESLRDMVEECYFETVAEALQAGHSQLVAHKEGVYWCRNASLLHEQHGRRDCKT